MSVLSQIVNVLERQSIIEWAFGKRTFLGRRFLDDRVSLLKHSPLGMFFYNQRALFFASSAGFLAVFAALILIAPTPGATELLALLAVAWVAGSVATLLLHRRFLQELSDWATHRNLGEGDVPCAVETQRQLGSRLRNHL